MTKQQVTASIEEAKGKTATALKVGAITVPAYVASQIELPHIELSFDEVKAVVAVVALIAVSVGLGFHFLKRR